MSIFDSDSFLAEIDIQKKLFIILLAIIVLIIIILIIGLSTYETPIEDAVEEFITALTHLDNPRLLGITTGVYRERLAAQRRAAEQIKKDLDFRGTLIDYKMRYLDKRPQIATVEIIARIQEAKKTDNIAYEHTFTVHFVKLNGEWKIADVQVVNVSIIG
ncbi:MAG: hypothetical protein ACOCQR_01975 [bacterium]